ncbi:MAG: SOS response-associated peptidase [Anaerolineae bacterium]|nr:SOS response-associated peptidase [Anaerolineae bacterium]MDW8173036.1 SOS response-associated peptidase [Anaerolineae bacterium]
MCGRYTLTANAETLQTTFQLETVEGYAPRYNIAPTQNVPIITHEQRRALTWVRWGLIPSWAKDPSIGATLINARAETLEEKPSFRDSFRRRRCLIPADGFYEWAKDGALKKPYYIYRRGRALFAFAGLWDAWKNPQGEWVRSCTIITTEPNDLIRPLHHRMAVMLTPEQADAWIDEQASPEDLHGLLCAHPSEDLALHEVSPRVNSAQAEGPQLIEPFQTPQQRDLF